MEGTHRASGDARADDGGGTCDHAHGAHSGEGLAGDVCVYQAQSNDVDARDVYANEGRVYGVRAGDARASAVRAHDARVCNARLVFAGSPVPSWVS